MTITTFEQPVRPDPAITLLLLGQKDHRAAPSGNTTITVEPAPPTSPYGCTVRSGGKTLQHHESPARMAAAIRAMLIESDRPWTLNGQLIKRQEERDTQPLKITASLEVQEGGQWRETTLVGPPEIRANCRIEDVLAYLPSLDRNAQLYLTELPSTSRRHSPVGRVAVRPVLDLGREAIEENDDTSMDDRAMDETQELMAGHCHNLPKPIGTSTRTWVAPHSNHPRELDRCRHDVRPIIVHGTPVVIRAESLDWAEQTSAIIALERADSELVPVIATFINPGGRSGQRAVEAWAEIDAETMMLKLRMPGGEERSFPMPILARGRYNHRQSSSLDVRLNRTAAQNPELVDDIIRCYEPSLRHSIEQEQNTSAVTAALTLTRLALQAASASE